METEYVAAPAGVLWCHHRRIDVRRRHSDIIWPRGGTLPMDPTKADARRHNSWICDVNVEQNEPPDQEPRVPIVEAWVEAGYPRISSSCSNPIHKSASTTVFSVSGFPFHKVQLTYSPLTATIGIATSSARRLTVAWSSYTLQSCEATALNPKSVTARYTEYVGGMAHKTGTITFAILPRT